MAAGDCLPWEYWVEVEKWNSSGECCVTFKGVKTIIGGHGQYGQFGKPNYFWRSLKPPNLRGETVFVKIVKVSSFSAFHTTFYFCFYDISWFLTGAVSCASLRAWANFTHIIKPELHYVLCEKMSSGEKISGDGKRTNSFRVCPRPPQPLELETKVFKEKAPTLLGPSLGSHERHYANQTTCWLWIHNLCVSIIILFLLTVL